MLQTDNNENGNEKEDGKKELYCFLLVSYLIATISGGSYLKLIGMLNKNKSTYVYKNLYEVFL